MRRALDYAKGLGVTLAQHCEDDAPGRRRGHARGALVEPARPPGHPGRGRGGHGRPRHRAGAADRAPRCTSCTSRRPARSTWSAGPRRRGCRHRRGGAAPHAAHPRRGGGLRPGLQGQPAAAHRRATWRPSSPGCATAPSTPWPPTTRPTRPRPRTSRSTRRPRACSGCRRRCRSPGRSSRRTLGPERVFALMSAQPAAIARLTATDPRPAGHSAQGGPVEVGGDGQPLRLRPRRHDGRWTRRAGQPQPQHALRRPHLRRRGPPHRAARRAGRDRRDGAAVSAAPTGDGDRPPALLVTADGAVFAGEAAGAAGARGHGRARVQHRHERLPGGDHRPVLRRPGRSPSPAPTSATTATNAADDEAPAPHCRGVVVRDLTDEPVELAGRPRGSSPSGPPRRPGADRRRHPAPDPPPAPGRGGAVRLRHGARGRAARRGGRGRRAPTAVDLVLGRHDRRASVHPGRARAPACASWPSTSG